jgi:23S rRNA pseudouridine2605 synthase
MTADSREAGDFEVNPCHARSMSGHPPDRAGTPRHGIARAISKLGIASRSEATRWVLAGRVAVNGSVVRDPEFPVRPPRDKIRIDGRAIGARAPFYAMLNKPRGLLTTTSDERGRDTIYRCLEEARIDGAPLPWLAPVGRLDKASEGLLLLSNDPQWAARITDPLVGIDKTYHVQIDRVPDDAWLRRLLDGIGEGGERLAARSARPLRAGAKNAWIEIVLDEGRNRQIRRLLAANDARVLRLVRVAIGSLVLGDLAKGVWRMLTMAEVVALAAPSDRDALREVAGDQAASYAP